MKPIKFPEANTTYAEDQSEYMNLPAYRAKNNDIYGVVTSCWKMDWRERIISFLTGEVWVSVMTFRQPLQPLSVMAEKPTFAPDKPKEPVSIADVNAILKK